MSSYEDVLSELKKMPLFEDEIDMSPSKLQLLRYYAHLNGDEVYRYRVNRMRVRFAIYFIEGQELLVLLRILERYPSFFELDNRDLISEYKRLLGRWLKRTHRGEYMLCPGNGERVPLSEIKEFVVRTCGVPNIDVFHHELREAICREIALGILSGFWRGATINACSRRRAELLSECLRRHLPDSFEVIVTGCRLLCIRRCVVDEEVGDRREAG